MSESKYLPYLVLCKLKTEAQKEGKLAVTNSKVDRESYFSGSVYLLFKNNPASSLFY